MKTKGDLSSPQNRYINAVMDKINKLKRIGKKSLVLLGQDVYTEDHFGILDYLDNEGFQVVRDSVGPTADDDTFTVTWEK